MDNNTPARNLMSMPYSALRVLYDLDDPGPGWNELPFRIEWWDLKGDSYRDTTNTWRHGCVAVVRVMQGELYRWRGFIVWFNPDTQRVFLHKLCEGSDVTLCSVEKWYADVDSDSESESDDDDGDDDDDDDDDEVRLNRVIWQGSLDSFTSIATSCMDPVFPTRALRTADVDYRLTLRTYTLFLKWLNDGAIPVKCYKDSPYYARIPSMPSKQVHAYTQLPCWFIDAQTQTDMSSICSGVRLAQ